MGWQPRGHSARVYCRKCGETDATQFGKDSRRVSGLKIWCRACENAYRKAYREANRDRLLEYERKTYAARAAERRERYANDPEYRAYMLAKNQANDAANPDAHRARSQRWVERNPDAKRRADRINSHNRRARKRVAGAERIDELVVLELHDGVCGICGRDVDPFDFELDHIVPLSRGGLHNYENVQPSHQFCNRSKYNRLQDELVRAA